MSFDPSTIRAQLRDLARRDVALEELRASPEDPSLLAFLRAAPLDEATFRDVFAAVADRLEPTLAWSIAQAAMEHVGDGDAGASTRYAMRRAAIVRWAAEVGQEAMPEVLAALSEDAETGLTALEAVAGHPETRRERVLSDVRPYLAHSSVARHPALAAVALRILDARRDEVPKAIALAWDDATITEASIVRALVEHGLVTGSEEVGPADGRRRLGTALVLDVLIRAHVVASFDAESGLAPVPYDALLRETLAPLARELAPIEVHVIARPTSSSAFAYEIRLEARGFVAEARFDDASDYYDVARLIALGNALLSGAGAASRWHALGTDDQTALVMSAPPKAVRALAKMLRARIVRAR